MPQGRQEFEKEKQRASEELLKMSKIASNGKSATDSKGERSAFGGILSFSSGNSLDSDAILILGILLILMGESKDNLLILTLFYILM